MFILLLAEGNSQLHAYLADKNPSKQQSLSLESYLIKPIQRILKYPLLLQSLRNLTDQRSDEHQHLLGKFTRFGISNMRNLTGCSRLDALKGMEKVAEHINEMQRIHEEYGAIFDHLFRQHQKACKQPIDLSPGKSSTRSFRCQ